MAEINPTQKFFEPIDIIAESLQPDISKIDDLRLQNFRKVILDQYEASKSINPRIREWKRLISRPANAMLQLAQNPMIKEFDSTKLPGSKEDFSGVANLEDDHVSFWLKNELRKQNVRFHPLEKAFSEPLVNDFLVNRLKAIAGRDRFSILAASAGTHSVCLIVPDHTIVKSPFLIKIDQKRSNTLMPVFINIMMGKSSEADIIIEENSTLTNGDRSLISVEINVFAEDSSRIGLVETQELSQNTQLFVSERFFLEQNAYANFLLIEKGGELVKRNLSVDLNREDSETVVTGLYHPHHSQNYFYNTHQNHNFSRTKSNLMFKGVLDSNAYTLWQGNIHVAKGTTGIDGYQVNNNLLLGQNAHAESIPGLEIIADDVRCSHGVTLSSIDQEQLFYLKSRGIDEKNGARLIVDGFTRGAIERVHSPRIIEYAHKILGIADIF